MKKLERFLLNKIIDLDIIEELKENKHLIKKENINNVQVMEKNDFLRTVKSIPLKYINFKACKNKQFYFYYSFPFFEKILQDFIDFQKSKKRFYSIDDGSERGKLFERLLKYKFRVHKKFNLDSYFEVQNLIKMELTEDYTNVNKEYLSSKNSVFIDQRNTSGLDYDFAIYKPQTKKLLLFQSKYIIDSGNVREEKSYYANSAKSIKKSFNKIVNNGINEIYILFISSIYYNYDRRDSAINILRKRKLNCIFYSLRKDLFYFNFKDDIRELELLDSYKLIPFSKEYMIQDALENPDLEIGDYIYNYKKDKKEQEDYEEEKKSVKLKGKNKKLKKIKTNLSQETKKNETFESTLFLQKKTIRNLNDLNKIYNDMIQYIRDDSTFKNEKLIKLLGPLKYIGFADKKIDLNQEYAIIFYLNENTLNIDFDKKIGLIIYNEGVHHFVDLKENVSYNTYLEFIANFSINYSYALGEKKNL